MNKDYLILGDALYESDKGYNVSLMHDEIALFKGLEFEHVLISHDSRIYDKDTVMKFLQRIYSMHKPGESYIPRESYKGI